MDELEGLPKGLSADDVRLALAEIGNLSEWPIDTTYVDAQLPAAFSKLLRTAYHGELIAARIAHLFKQARWPCRLQDRGARQEGLARARVPGGRGLRDRLLLDGLGWADAVATAGGGGPRAEPLRPGSGRRLGHRSP